MIPAITSLYAGLLGLMLVVLAIRVVTRRRSIHIAFGDGEDEELRRRIRTHGNFIEYVPLALLLMLLAEFSAAAHWLVHAMGMALIAGRGTHAWSLHASNLRARVIGMVLTFWVLVTGAGCCLIAAARAFV